MSVHLAARGYDPDLDYNMLVVDHGVEPVRQTEVEKRIEYEVLWARQHIDECIDIS